MSEPCIPCEQARKTEKKLKLESDYQTKSAQGTTLAKEAGVTGFFIAVAKNRTGYIVAIERPADSSLEWGYVSIL